jgi:hypothetical protein
MNISIEDTLSLLRKWQDERRLIQCGLVYSFEISCTVVGRIEEVEVGSIRINARSLRTDGKFDSLLFNLVDSTEILFHDWRDAPEEVAPSLKAAYEAHIFVRFRDCHCEIYALKTGDELLGL